MQVYIQAKSKKAINEALARGEGVTATEYTLFDTNRYNLAGLAAGTSVKIFDKFVGGQPYAKAYGTWNGKVLK